MTAPAARGPVAPVAPVAPIAPIALGRAALVAAGAAWGTDRLLRRTVGSRPRWNRRNYRDRPVVLTGGPAVASGALLGVAVAGGAPGALVAGGTAAVLGCYDDLYGDRHARGLAGHLAALRERRVTTGMLKLVGLTVAGAVAGGLQRRGAVSAVADAALVAGTANLVNLLDLRPGRALKVTVLVGSAVGLAGGGPPVRESRRDGAGGAGGAGAAVAAAAAAAAMLPADLGEQVMVGDCGANALGALLGHSLATGLGRTGRAAALTAVVGLTLASERVSFTEVIARTPWLRAVDEWGRR